MLRLRLLLFAGTLASGSASFAAEPFSNSSPFGVAAVSDEALGSVRGTALPPINRMAAFADLQARNDFRLMGSINRIQMDVWWGTIGSELVANAVRAQL